MIPMPLLIKQIEQHPYPLIFATISGAHLYGFPSPDSDFDLRGVHVLPLKEVVGLHIGPETIETTPLCVPGAADRHQFDADRHGRGESGSAQRDGGGAAVRRWLIQRKVAGAEKERLTEADLGFHRGEYIPGG